MKSISYTVVTVNAQALDFQFPLNPQTQSEAAVTEIITALLTSLCKCVGTNRELCDGDLLQVMAITLAARVRTVKDDPDTLTNSRMIYWKVSYKQHMNQYLTLQRQHE